MEKKVYSIRDSKSEVYGFPFFKNTHGEAERDFRSVTNDAQSNINKYPEDYDLYYLGTYDDQSGKIEALDTPQHMVKAVQLLNVKN